MKLVILILKIGICPTQTMIQKTLKELDLDLATFVHSINRIIILFRFVFNKALSAYSCYGLNEYFNQNPLNVKYVIIDSFNAIKLTDFCQVVYIIANKFY